MCVLALRLCLCFRGRAKFQGLIRTKPDLPSRLTSVSLANRAENVLISPATQLRLDQISCEIHENLNKPGDFFFLVFVVVVGLRTLLETFQSRTPAVAPVLNRSSHTIHVRYVRNKLKWKIRFFGGYISREMSICFLVPDSRSDLTVYYILQGSLTDTVENVGECVFSLLSCIPDFSFSHRPGLQMVQAPLFTVQDLCDWGNKKQ